MFVCCFPGNSPGFHSELGLPALQRALHVVRDCALRRESAAGLDLTQVIDRFDDFVLVRHEVDDVVLLGLALEFRGNQRAHAVAQLLLDDQDLDRVAMLQHFL